MPMLSVFYGILIQMFWNDHAPPHFHALDAEDECSVRHPNAGSFWRGNCRAALGARHGMGQGPWNRVINMQRDQITRRRIYRIRRPGVPPIVPKARWRVASVEALPDYRLKGCFSMV